MNIHFVFLLAVALLLTNPMHAAETAPQKSEPTVLEKTDQAIQKSAEQVAEKMSETRDRRERSSYFALVNYSPIDFLIANKLGLSFGLVNHADKTWELEYLRGSLAVPVYIGDLGTMADQRISLIGRSYFGRNSFNFSYGLSHFDFSLHLGDQLLNRISGGNYPSIDLVKIQSLGFNIGLGNRWIFNRNITFGVDWISWAQPVITLQRKSGYLDYATDQQDKENVDRALKVIAYFPRLALLKLQLGISF